MPAVRLLLLFIVLAAACKPTRPGGSAGMAGDGGHGGQQVLISAGASGASGLGGQGGTGCKREVRLTGGEIGAPEPFDVILVADHSQSLSWSHEDLATGLSTLLADARGRDARFFVLTPTQYGASSSAAVDRLNGQDLVLYRDAVSGEAFSGAMTEYVQSCADTSGTPIECPAYDPSSTLDYTADGAWRFVMPEPVAAITAAMTEDEIAAQQAAISTAILALSGTGSPNEQPLCTLNRYLLQNPAPLPEHAVFLVISDEDDVTLPDECVTEYHFAHGTTESPLAQTCTADCDVYQYFLAEPAFLQRLMYTCAPLDDLGVAHPESAFSETSFLNEPLGSECTAQSDPAPCSPVGLEGARSECGANHVVTACTATCVEADLPGCTLETADQSEDHCTTSHAFVHEGVEYASLTAYCDATVGDHPWSRCSRQGYLAGTTPTFTTQLVPLVRGATTDALITSFTSEATARFGAGGYFAGVIGFDPAFSCAPQSGQSHATNLKGIATSPEDIFPICGDYSAALESVRAFTDYLLDTDLELVLADDERVESVAVEAQDGARRPLDPSLYTYDRARHLLLLEMQAINPTDIAIAVEVEKTCVRVVE